MHHLQLKFSKKTNSNSFSICEKSKCKRCRNGASSVGRSSARLARRLVLSANFWAYVFSNGIAYRLFAICFGIENGIDCVLLQLILIKSVAIYVFAQVVVRCIYWITCNHRHNKPQPLLAIECVCVWSHTPLYKKKVRWRIVQRKKVLQKGHPSMCLCLCNKLKINCYSRRSSSRW